MTSPRASVRARSGEPPSCPPGCGCPARLALRTKSGVLRSMGPAVEAALATGALPAGSVVVLLDCVRSAGTTREAISRSSAASTGTAASKTSRPSRTRATPAATARRSAPAQTSTPVPARQRAGAGSRSSVT